MGRMWRADWNTRSRLASRAQIWLTDWQGRAIFKIALGCSVAVACSPKRFGVRGERTDAAIVADRGVVWLEATARDAGARPRAVGWADCATPGLPGDAEAIVSSDLDRSAEPADAPRRSLQDAGEGQDPDGADVFPLRSMVITELMIDPTGDDATREWIELQNAGPVVIDLRGWVLHDGARQAHEIGRQLLVHAGQRLVLGASADRQKNGGVPVDYEYGSQLRLANRGDALLLSDPAAQVVDRVVYSSGAGGGWPVVPGASMALRDIDLDTAHQASWCVSSARWLGGEGDRGSPGLANDCRLNE